MLQGVTVSSITLFALGSMTRIQKGRADASTEFWMGVGAPILSSTISFCTLGLAYILGWDPIGGPDSLLMAMIVWLGYLNLGLTIFNLVPGLPMGGGRVLRAIVWSKTYNTVLGTRLAYRFGQIFAICLVILGIAMVIGSLGLIGIWLILLGFFLRGAGKASYAQLQTEMFGGLQGVKVSKLMLYDSPVVDGQTNIQSFFDEYLLPGLCDCFVIIEQEKSVGLITIHEIKFIKRALWPYKTVYDVMRPLEQLHPVTPETPIIEVLKIIRNEDVKQLPVMANGRMAGIISLNQILHFMHSRAELNL
ncbi:MAG: CBS domain-containing protein [Acidobacteria bacterium]|nr:CBS domain-containing protein [Acidobacteriota bacterium]